MIIDTNIYSAIRLNDPRALKLLESTSSIELPLPVIAELQYGFRLGSRTEYNETELQTFLSQAEVRVLLPTATTAGHYADLAVWCRKKGRVPSNNDMWIAALAKESGQVLVTYDKDFDVFTDLFGDKLLRLGA